MTTSRSTARKPRTPKPTLKVTGLNLDRLEVEGSAEEKEPYTFVLGGRMFTLANRDDLDWRPMAGIGPNDAVRLIRNLLGPEEFGEFAKHRLTIRSMNELVNDYAKYYGLVDKQGEDGALPTS